jgi:hypothetical protein
MLSANYLREQSAKFHNLAIAAKQPAEQEEYGALSAAYESLALMLAREAGDRALRAARA